jgi:hypothetical protein
VFFKSLKEKRKKKEKGNGIMADVRSSPLLRGLGESVRALTTDSLKESVSFI